MLIEEIKALFPITTMVTQEIIDKSNRMDTQNCIGANTVKSVLPDNFGYDLHWGTSSGGICNKGEHKELLTFSSTHNMMRILNPTEVTFTIVN